MFRNPVDRAFSQYWRYRVAGYTKLDFHAAIKAHPMFVRRSMYAADWEKYAEQFGKHNCLPLIFEEVKDNPSEYFEKLCHFLGIDPSFRPDFQKAQMNKAKFNRSQKVVDLLTTIKNTLSGLRMDWIVMSAKKIKLKKALEIINKKKETYPHEISQAERAEVLNKYFQEDIIKFSYSTEKDLSIWDLN
jgi:hypothetical protein